MDLNRELADSRQDIERANEYVKFGSLDIDFEQIHCTYAVALNKPGKCSKFARHGNWLVPRCECVHDHAAERDAFSLTVRQKRRCSSGSA